MADGRTDIVRIKPITRAIEWQWVQCHNKFAMTDDSSGIIGYINNRPGAVVTYHNWAPNSVELHHVITKPMLLRHGWLEIVLTAAFGDDRQVAYGMVPSNSTSFSYLAKLGVKETGKIPNGYSPGVDVSIQTLQREDCKYLKENQDGNERW